MELFLGDDQANQHWSKLESPVHFVTHICEKDDAERLPSLRVHRLLYELKVWSSYISLVGKYDV